MNLRTARNLSLRKATQIARGLGWTVEPDRRSGEVLFTKPDGKIIRSGLHRSIPWVLARALHAATKEK